MNLLNKHKQHFPEIPSLYKEQLEALNNLNSRNNTLAIIPTGGGKSLIYQLFGVDQSGITLVISPLIALMNEQVEELKENGIHALALNSNLSFAEQRETLRNLGNTNIKFIYLSPERLQNGIFRASLIASDIKVAQVAIDEAHCISQWGESFRPDYAQIQPFIQFLKDKGHQPVVFALTATLAQQARAAIQQEFEISDKNTVLPNTVIRQNLKLNFTKVDSEKEKEEVLFDFIKQYQPKKCLVYLYSKKKCRTYAEAFALKEYRTDYYHADRSKEAKEQLFKQFKRGKIDILFATTAFGMGINIPDIDAVVHLQIPHSVEEYYQQVGRGWRKKTEVRSCQCLLLWSDTNVKRRREQIESEKFELNRITRVIDKLIGKYRKDKQIVSKDKEEYLKASENLQLIRYKLEEKSIIETIGEMNGTPKDILLNNSTPLWDTILSNKKALLGFRRAAKELNIPLKRILDHLYEQEFQGNIKKFPATKRTLYFKVLKADISTKELNEMMAELNTFIAIKKQHFQELYELFESEHPEEMIQKLLA